MTASHCFSCFDGHQYFIGCSNNFYIICFIVYFYFLWGNFQFEFATFKKFNKLCSHNSLE